MNRERPFAVAVSFLLLFAFLHSGMSQESDLNDVLESSFRQAISAQGADYGRLRSNIVARSTAAVPFLEGNLASDDFHVRVLSLAFLSRITEREQTQSRARAFEALFDRAARMHPTMLDSIQLVCFGYNGPGMATSPVRDDLHDDAAVPFLLEAAMKGGPRTLRRSDSTPSGQAPDSWERCLAAVLAGSGHGAEVTNVLRELLRSDQFELRVCAATGLRRGKSIEGTELLIQALSDSNAEVRRTSRVGLVDLTDQDFGEDRAKWIEWWRQNKSKWPFNDRKPGAKMLLIK